MWIVSGDMTSSGGRVITGSRFTDIDGKPVARVTDKATCPAHKGVYPIVDGDATTIIDGQPVALHGSKLACGCTVLAVQQSRVFVEQAGGGARQPASTAAATPAAHASAPTHRSLFDLAFLVRDQDTGEPLAGANYKVTLASGKVFEGVTDASGMTEPAHSDTAEVATIEVNYHAQSETEPTAAACESECSC